MEPQAAAATGPSHCSTASVAAGCLLLLAARAAPGQGQPPAAPPDPPPITVPRYGEDYSYLRDPANRTGAWWEPFKFIPLDDSGEIYLTLGDEIRVRYEYYRNNEFGNALNVDDGYVRYRMVPYADLHLGPSFRVFGELMAAYADHPGIDKNPETDETGVEFLQAFADVHLDLGGAGELTLRGGRQVMVYGSGRLINAGPNIRLAFDGGLVRWDVGDWRTDVFVVRPVKHTLDSFGDSADDTRAVWSVYATRMLPSMGPNAGFDLFYIGYEDSFAEFNQGGGDEHRHTLGVRVFGARGPWRWDCEGHYQFGSFADGDIAAWSVATQLRYRFFDQPLKPWVGLRATALSGDRDPDDPDLQTFNAMFPRGGYFGETGVIGPGNLLSLHPAVGVDLGSGWTLEAALLFYWRQSLGDGIYGFGGNLIRPADGSEERYIATQGDVALGWRINRNLSFDVSYSVLIPGPFIEEIGPDETVHFVGAQLLFKF